jgi:hypothetical protein
VPAQERRTLGNDGMSLGEVARMIEALRADTTTRFDKIDERLDRLDSMYVRRETYTADRKASEVYIAGMESRVAKLEGTLQWVLRTGGGAVLAGIVTALFAAAKWM